MTTTLSKITTILNHYEIQDGTPRDIAEEIMRVLDMDHRERALELAEKVLGPTDRSADTLVTTAEKIRTYLKGPTT